MLSQHHEFPYAHVPIHHLILALCVHYPTPASIPHPRSLFV